jgi:hypothetical protein
MKRSTPQMMGQSNAAPSAPMRRYLGPITGRHVPPSREPALDHFSPGSSAGKQNAYGHKRIRQCTDLLDDEYEPAAYASRFADSVCFGDIGQCEGPVNR